MEGAVDGEPVELQPYQKEMMAMLTRPGRIYILPSRQIGKSEWRRAYLRLLDEMK